MSEVGGRISAQRRCGRASLGKSSRVSRLWDEAARSASTLTHPPAALSVSRFLDCGQTLLMIFIG